MKSFQFRFESFLKKIKGQEQAVQKEMAPFVKQYNQTQASIQASLRSIEGYTKQKNQYLHYPSMRDLYMTGSLNLQGQLQAFKQKLLQIEVSLRPFREKLKALFMQRRSIETIKQKDYLLYLKAKNKKEQDLLEENFSIKQHVMSSSFRL